MQTVTFVLVRHGFGELVGRLGLPRFGGPPPSLQAASLSRDRLGKRIARVLADLGPTYVKLGQLMATREDLLPPEIISALRELHASAPPMKSRIVSRVIYEALGQTPEQAFAAFDHAPLAAASIGQVHRARLHSGEEVVVKVQRPHLPSIVAGDLALMRMFAKLLVQAVPEVASYDPLALLDAFERSIDDQATFTGIDDGQRTKTINIKLREDKKNGYFGKIDGGYGTNNYYDGQALFNRFKAKMKFSVYGTVGNDGKTGLGWQDNQKYTGGDMQIIDGGGGNIVMFGGGGDDLDSWNGSYNGKGTPLARTGGAHFDDKFNSDKESVNVNYKIGSLTLDGTDNTISQNFAPNFAINSNTNQTYHDYMFRQKLDMTYTIKLDTTSDLRLHVDGTLKNSKTKSQYSDFETSNQDGSPLNQSTRDIDNTVDGRQFNASAFYTKKFRKKGRTFSWNISEAYNESQAHGNLYSNYDYHLQNPAHDSTVIVDQYKTNRLASSVLNSNMTYTEPLSKTLTMVVNYGFATLNNTADRKSFDPSSPGVYTLLDTAYSNNFRLKQTSNQGGAVLNFKKDKVTFNLGTKVTDEAYDQLDLNHGYETKRNFVNWDPQGFFRYTIAKQSSFSMYYNGRTTQPTIDQLQPLRVNNDLNNEVIGNPKLTPSFTNNFRMNYNNYKVLTDVSLFSYASFSFTSNPIVGDTKLDSVGSGATPGKATTQFINLNQKPYNFNGGIYYGRKLSGAGIQVGFDLNANGNKNYAVTNDQLNASTSNTYGISLNLSKYAEKKYDFNVSFGPNYTFSKSTLEANTNNNGHGWQGNGGASVFLPWKFQINTDANYQYNSPTGLFAQSYSKLLWNAKITKSFNKDENFKLVLACNDILNQNSGFERNLNGTQITQDHYTTLKRFFMLSFVWDFNHMGGGAPKPGAQQQ